MTERFRGKTAIVTGAGSGIGEAIARQLAAEGARVVVSDVSEEAAGRVAGEIGEAARTDVTDVSDAAAVERLVQVAEDFGGGLHLMVNNAGIGGEQAATGDYPVEDWRRVIDINLSGVFYGLRFGLPAIERAGGGAVVNMSSILGSVGLAQSPAYVAAKHGVNGLTKTAAMEYAQRGVRINAVGPAFIDTPLLRDLPQEMKDALDDMHPVGRLGTSEEVSELTCFLLSDAASFITGSYHLVDGGYTAR